MDGGQSKDNPYKRYERRGIAQRIYLVFLSSNVSSKYQPHTKLLAARLTRADAEAVVALNPGSYIYKITATKKPKIAVKGDSNVEGT